MKAGRSLINITLLHRTKLLHIAHLDNFSFYWVKIDLISKPFRNYVAQAHSVKFSNLIEAFSNHRTYFWQIYISACFFYDVAYRGVVEDTRLDAKDTKKIRGQGQGQPFRGQTLSRPRTGMLEAKDQGHKRKCSPKKKKRKRSSQKFFRRSPKKKKVFTKIFQAITTKTRFPKNFSSAPQNFNNSKTSAVLEPRTGQFSRT